MAEMTPMMRQYLEVKERCKDCILFFRLGDFYEMFFEDAKVVSKELELVLTGKDCGLPERAPMCGIPYHASLSYIARLVSKGYKVAIGEQLEDPATAKGIVKRDIVKIYTPGTVTDDQMLDQKVNNYIMAVYEFKGMYGLAAADLSTGELHYTSLTVGSTYNHLANEIARFAPSEVMINESAQSAGALDSFLKQVSGAHLGYVPDTLFDYTGACARLSGVLDGKGKMPSEKELSKNEYAIRAFGALMTYLEDTQRMSLDRMMEPDLYTVNAYMIVDAASRRNLEITETLRDKAKRGSLLWVLDRTETAMGGRALRRWLEQPLIDPDAISARLDGVGELKDSFMSRCEIRELLHGVYDMERLAGKVSLGSVNARDLASLRQSLSKLPYVKQALSFCKAPLLRTLDEHIDLLEDVHALLEVSIVDDPPMLMRDGGIIREGFSPEVDECRKATVCGKDWLTELEAREREQTGIKNLKVGYNKVFGYYIDVSNSFKSLVPAHYIRKQTLANNERYITDELKKMEDTILGAEERLLRLETELFGQIRGQVGSQCGRLKQTAYAIAELDALCSLAEVADRENYCRPEVVQSETCEIVLQESRHPVVEKMLGAGEFVPNDILLNCAEDSLLVITGPNMAGKSTYMRQAALIVLMAQMGSFVPASSARISVVDKLFTRVGASDDLASGRSTFMVEMSEVANILANATSKSFLILDEIGRGTSTFDGLSIAWAVLEYIVKNIGARTMFATHYHELTELEGKLPGVKNYSSDVRKKGEDIVFLRKIRRGEADGSYGVCVAALAGIPKAVTLRAEELSRQLEEAGLYAKNGKKGKKQPDVYEQDGLDLISYTASTVMQDELIEELKQLNVQELTPIEAMNVLYRLHQKAEQRI